MLKSIVVAEALPILAELETPLDAAAAAARWAPSRDINAEEAIAYSLVLAEETEAALRELNQLIERLSTIPHDYPWKIALDKRVNLIKGKLLSDPNEAKTQLAEWRKESLRNLKLEKYAEEIYSG